MRRDCSSIRHSCIRKSTYVAVLASATLFPSLSLCLRRAHLSRPRGGLLGAGSPLRLGHIFGSDLTAFAAAFAKQFHQFRRGHYSPFGSVSRLIRSLSKSGCGNLSVRSLRRIGIIVMFEVFST